MPLRARQVRRAPLRARQVRRAPLRARQVRRVTLRARQVRRAPLRARQVRRAPLVGDPTNALVDFVARLFKYLNFAKKLTIVLSNCKIPWSS